MRTLLPALPLALLATPQESRDLPGLAIAIVEAAGRDIGCGPGATHPPVASGPFYIDGQSFVDAFDWISGGRGNEIRDTLISPGYLAESYENLRREAVDSLGYQDYWLSDDAILLRLHGMDTSEYAVTALVTYSYTYERHSLRLREICPRMLRIRLLLEDGVWSSVETKVVGAC